MRTLAKRIMAAAGCWLALLPLAASATTTTSGNVTNVLYIECGSVVDDVFYGEVSGSGVLILDDWILTNAHVILDDYGEPYASCMGGISESSYLAPELTFELRSDLYRYDDSFDYAFLSPYDPSTGEELALASTTQFANGDSMLLGEEISLMGYPGVGGSTITTTFGSISGFEGYTWMKTDAAIEHGNSGGAAFDAAGNYVGIPTSAVSGELNTIGYIQNVNAVFEDAFGSDFIARDYATIYTEDNYVCYEDDCFNFASDEDTWLDDAEEEIAEDDSADGMEIDAGAYEPAKFDADLQIRMLGRILLQVEQHGEAWYVNPSDKLRYYMADGDVAYQMMREMSLGITDANLSLIPFVATSDAMLSAANVCSTNAVANSVRGKILLQVEQRGEAWYVHPDTCQRVYMADGDAAYIIMRYLSLGIANADLQKLPSGD